MGQKYSVGILGCVLALCCGCGGALEGSVQGKVTLDNAPLDRGTVTFHAINGGAAAYGRIQTDGSYTISTGTHRGLLSGDYVVTVVATAAENNNKGDVPGKLLTPSRYQSTATSPFRFTVQRGHNTIDLPLKSK